MIFTSSFGTAGKLAAVMVNAEKLTSRSASATVVFASIFSAPIDGVVLSFAWCDTAAKIVMCFWSGQLPTCG